MSWQDDVLTDCQREVLAFYVHYALAHGYPPALREMCRHFSIASTNGARDFLVALEKKGYVRSTALRSRGVEFTDKALSEILGPPCSFCGGSGRKQRRHQ